MLWQMHIETGSKKLKGCCEAIENDILGCYDATLPFGFKTEASTPGDEVLLIDNPGLLDGVAGILLPLLFRQSNVRRPWLSLFVL